MEKLTKVYKADGSHLMVNEHQLNFLEENNLSTKNTKQKKKVKEETVEDK